MLAHELRRRMAALRVVGEVIGLARDGAADLDRMLGLLLGELDDLDRLAREVLDGAGDDGGGAIVDVVPAVSAAARTVATARGAAVEVRAPGGPVPVKASATMLRQAVENLLDNAARYTDAGPVEVEVRPEPDGGVVDVVVADHGPGPGGTDGGRGRPGNGLGLFLVRRFLDAAGGHAWVAERPGGGSVVGIRLPLARQATALGDAVNT